MSKFWPNISGDLLALKAWIDNNQNWILSKNLNLKTSKSSYSDRCFYSNNLLSEWEKNLIFFQSPVLPLLLLWMNLGFLLVTMVTIFYTCIKLSSKAHCDQVCIMYTTHIFNDLHLRWKWVFLSSRLWIHHILTEVFCCTFILLLIKNKFILLWQNLTELVAAEGNLKHIFWALTDHNFCLKRWWVVGIPSRVPF